MAKQYSFFAYCTQGDDLEQHINDEDTPEAAFISWAGCLEESVKRMRKLARLLIDKRVDIDTDEHNITLTPLDEETEKVLDKAVEMDLVGVDEGLEDDDIQWLEEEEDIEDSKEED